MTISEPGRLVFRLCEFGCEFRICCRFVASSRSGIFDCLLRYRTYVRRRRNEVVERTSRCQSAGEIPNRCSWEYLAVPEVVEPTSTQAPRFRQERHHFRITHREETLRVRTSERRCRGSASECVSRNSVISSCIRSHRGALRSFRRFSIIRRMNFLRTSAEWRPCEIIVRVPTFRRTNVEDSKICDDFQEPTAYEVYSIPVVMIYDQDLRFSEMVSRRYFRSIDREIRQVAMRIGFRKL